MLNEVVHGDVNVLHEGRLPVCALSPGDVQPLQQWPVERLHQVRHRLEYTLGGAGKYLTHHYLLGFSGRGG